MTPEELETLPKELEKLFSRLETQVMQEVVDRIKISGEIIPSVQHRLERLEALGVSRRKIQETIDAALKEANIKVDKAYEQAAESDSIRYQSIYKAAGKQFLPYAENRWLQEIIQTIRAQTKEKLVNITGTTGFQADVGGRKVFTPLSEYLQRSLDTAVLGITTGTTDYNTAIKKVINEMTMSGLRTVDYASGHSDRVEVAARRAIMTGTSQMMDKMNAKYAAELETDYWEVDWHGGARNTGTGYRNHQSWQGRVYSSKEMVSVCGLGEALGFAGINCYHIRFPFIPDVSVRQYTDEWLAGQNQRENTKRPFAGKEYDTYAATQYQRKLERTLRKQKQDIKLMEHADVDPDDITLAKARYQATSHTYTQFSKAMGLPQQRERLYSGRSLSKEFVDINYLKLPDEVLSITGMTEDTRIEIEKTIALMQKQYNIRIDTVTVESAGPKDIMLSGPYEEEGRLKFALVINQDRDYNRLGKLIEKRYKEGRYAGQSVSDYVIHELAHIMTIQDCKTAEEYYAIVKEVNAQFIPGISKYADKTGLGIESLAEAFVRYRNGEQIPAKAKRMIKKYIERWRK
jgi:hypothetical protein